MYELELKMLAYEIMEVFRLYNSHLKPFIKRLLLCQCIFVAVKNDILGPLVTEIPFGIVYSIPCSTTLSALFSSLFQVTNHFNFDWPILSPVLFLA